MKNLTAILLAVLIALSVFSVAAYSSGGYKNGDVDRNGSTKIQDANLIQQFLAGMKHLDNEQLALADYDLNGKVDIVDVTEIQLVLAEAKSAPSETEQTEPTESSQTESQTSPTEASSDSEPATEAVTQSTTESATEAVTQSTTESATQPTTEAVTQPATEVETAPNPKVSSKIKVYFTNSLNWSNVYFYVYNSDTGAELSSWPGKRITSSSTNNYGEQIFNSEIDTSKYDRVIFTNGDAQTINVPVNKASSGFYISDSSRSKAMLVGTYAYTGSDGGTMNKLTLDYPSGYKKKIWIWTPADYKATGDKFRTLYVLDGQNLFDDDHSDGFGGWEVTDAVESMISNGGRGTIIVGIDNGNNKRDSELTPDLGNVLPKWQSDFSVRTGEQFSDFVVNTVMPYVQSNYNSSKAACDNMIAGSSSGGLEAFYIGMEHSDKFGMIGSLSPAFLLFDDSIVASYLSKFDLSADNIPKLYLYNGKDDELEKNIYPGVIRMYERFSGAEADVKLSIEENAQHNEAFWRVIFPECISYLLEI